jgi:HD-like signal output (HDOD) protein
MGIFGKRKAEAGEVAAPQPGREQIQNLAPFEALGEPALSRIAEASLIDSVRARAVVAILPETLVFLHRGELALERQGHPRLLLKDSQPGSAFPLPGDPAYRITAQTPCQLLKVPSRFTVLAAGKAQHESDTSWRETNTEDTLYQDFYHELKSGNCELPSMPDLAPRIGAVIDDPTTASEHIARVIQTDPALAARVMSVVNSAAYNTGPAIQNLSQAVSRIGRKQIRNLVFSFIVKGMFRTKSTKLKKRMQALWSHSCHVGAIAAILAKQTPGLDAERALLAGLVHDIGVVPVLDKARQYPRLLDDPEMLDQIAAQLRGEIGVLTLRQLGFDKEFIDIAARAEDWMRAGEAVPDYLDVVLLAQLHALVGTPQMHDVPRIDKIPAFRKLAGGALSPRGSMAIIDGAQRDIEELRSLLETS